MTRAHRRDKGITYASIITGLRLESDLATRLRAAATERAEGNVAVLARFLLATGLGWSAEAANTSEDRDLKPRKLCGLAVPEELYTRLRGAAARLHLAPTGAARHLLRRGLGVDELTSLQREEKFASLAAALHEVREAHE